MRGGGGLVLGDSLKSVSCSIGVTTNPKGQQLYRQQGRLSFSSSFWLLRRSWLHRTFCFTIAATVWWNFDDMSASYDMV